MQQSEQVVELEDVTTSNPESISSTQVEEEIHIAQQGEIGQSYGARNKISNPNLEMPAKLDEIMGPGQAQEHKKVLVEDITDQPDFTGEEEGIEVAEAGTSVAGQKRKTPDSMEITLPFLPNAVITINDMLGKVPKPRYADHDVREASKFPELAEENYLINMGKLDP
jgi:hypothetical protein